MNALTSIAPRLKQLVLMLSSSQDGEILAAVHAIDMTLRSANADWHVFADALVTVAPAQPPPKPPPPRSPTWARVENPKAFLDRIKAEPWLSPWEREFATSIREQLAAFVPRVISEKQRLVLDRLVRRAVEHGVQV